MKSFMTNGKVINIISYSYSLASEWTSLAKNNTNQSIIIINII